MTRKTERAFCISFLLMVVPGNMIPSAGCLDAENILRREAADRGRLAVGRIYHCILPAVGDEVYGIACATDPIQLRIFVRKRAIHALQTIEDFVR